MSPIYTYGMSSQPRPGRPRDRLIVYVDGFNLYHGMHDAYGHKYLWLDLVSLSQALRPESQLVTVKYFTASVLDEPEAQGRQDHYIDALTTLHPEQMRTTRGRYQSKQRWCRSCGATFTLYEEKETDVNIATQLVKDAALRNMTAALIISADSDLAPAVRVAKELRPDLFVAAAFPPKRKSHELAALMPASFPIRESKLRKSQMETNFELGEKSFARPSKWQ